MTYAGSQAFAGRSSVLQFASGSGFTELAEVKTIQFSGSKYDLADVTNMQSGNFREWLPTLADSGELSFSANFIPDDGTQNTLLNFFNTAALVAWQVVLPNGLGYFEFNAYVSSLDKDLPVDKEATTSGKLKITGEVTFIEG
jgi:predicted secreted protein